MDNSPENKENIQNNNFIPGNDTFSTKNVIIIVLVVLLLLSFLGINLLDILSNLIKMVINIFGPIFSQILSLLGYTTGTILNKSADVVGDTTKAAVDIAEGTLQNVGDLMIKASKSNINSDSKLQLDNALNMQLNDKQFTMNDLSEDPIQKPISSNKSGWCLVGEYANKRGCIEIGEADKCMSGQVFPNQKMCLNPNITGQLNQKY